MSEAAWIEISWSAFALLVILGACELFTNGIEWLGRTLNLSDGAVGSVLAAVGTAMPETIVPLVAILLIGGPSANEVAIGGILGAPFMLGTLAFFVTGVAVFLFQRRRPTRRRMVVKTEVLKWDVGAFVVAYLLAISSSFLPHHWERVVLAACLVVGYVLYVRRHFRTGPGEDERPPELRRLYLRWREREASPHVSWSVSQSLIGLALILVGARVFVSHLTTLCTDLGADPRLLALLVVPVATELPEKFNSVIWVRQGKDTLAIGNITGAMVFQSCIPVAVGMLFTSWHLTRADLISAAIALTSSAVLFTSLVLGRRLSPWVLLGGVVGYGLFLALVLR